MLRVYDPMHRRQNDSVLAMGESGALRRCMNLSLYNLKFGPWLKGGWYRMLQETGEQLRDMSPNDPLLLLFWPDIVKDRNFVLGGFSEWQGRLLEDSSKPTLPHQQRPQSVLEQVQRIERGPSPAGRTLVQPVLCDDSHLLASGWASYADQLWCPDDCVAALMEGTSTKAQAKASAKAALEKMRGKAVNSLRSVTKYMNDPEVKCQSRLIACVLAPEAEAASRMLVEMRDASTALQYFVSWSHWGWLEAAEKHLGLLEDRGPAQLGPNRPSHAVEPRAKRWPGGVRHSNHTKVLNAMLKYRGGSNLWHTWGPGAAAGLLSTDETQVRSSLLWHRNLFDAVAEVRRTGSLAAQGLLKDSMVKDAFFGHVFHLLRIEDWREVSETAQNFLTNVFSGLLNTKLVEDANKFQREQEDRGNNSKSVPMTEAWQTVSKHEVLKAYKRPEVQASTQYLVPAKWNIEQVCRTNVRRTDAKTPEQEADFEFLRRVTGNQTWPAFTPETEQRLFCNHALLVHVVEKAWISGLVQSGTLLRWQGQPHFVLRAYEQGLLLWPMQDTQKSRLAFQKPLNKLVWGFLFDVESCKVATVTPTPPMIGLRSQRAGVQVVAGAWSPCSKTCWSVGVPDSASPS